jgi:hypothetical protein
MIGEKQITYMFQDLENKFWLKFCNTQRTCSHQMSAVLTWKWSTFVLAQDAANINYNSFEICYPSKYEVVYNREPK